MAALEAVQGSIDHPDQAGQAVFRAFKRLHPSSQEEVCAQDRDISQGLPSVRDNRRSKAKEHNEARFGLRDFGPAMCCRCCFHQEQVPGGPCHLQPRFAEEQEEQGHTKCHREFGMCQRGYWQGWPGGCGQDGPRGGQVCRERGIDYCHEHRSHWSEVLSS